MLIAAFLAIVAIVLSILACVVDTSSEIEANWSSPNRPSVDISTSPTRPGGPCFRHSIVQTRSSIRLDVRSIVQTSVSIGWTSNSIVLESQLPDKTINLLLTVTHSECVDGFEGELTF